MTTPPTLSSPSPVLRRRRLSATTASWIGLGLLLSVTLLLLMAQHRQTRDLKRLAKAADAQRGDFEGLLREAEALRGRMPSADRRAQLRGDRDAVERLRAEIEGMERRQAPLQAAQVSPSPGLPAQAWRNAGALTVPSALETALWAASVGDHATLAQLLLIEPSTRSRLATRISRLPPALRGRFPTPEDLVAGFTARDIPADAILRVRSIGVLPTSVSANASGVARVLLSLERTGAGPDREITLRRSLGSWRLVVPRETVERYESELDRL